MYLRLLLLAAVVYFASPKALAQTNSDQAEETNETVIESDSDPEQITHRQTLAVHMGLTNTEVIFGKPRNFRAESLNSFGLDPIADEEP